MTRSVVAAIVALGAMTAPSATSIADTPQPVTRDQQEVLDVEQAWVAAEMNRDAAALHAILDDQFVAIYGTGAPQDKESFIKAHSAEASKVAPSQSLSDRRVIISGDTAVIIGTDTLQGTDDQGKPYTKIGRYTTTYVKRQGRWLALAELMVRVPPAK